jgi:hypothetical protein
MFNSSLILNSIPVDSRGSRIRNDHQTWKKLSVLKLQIKCTTAKSNENPSNINARSRLGNPGFFTTNPIVFLSQFLLSTHENSNQNQNQKIRRLKKTLGIPKDYFPLRIHFKQDLQSHHGFEFSRD